MTGAIFLRQVRLLAPLLALVSTGLLLFEFLIVWIADSIDLGANFEALIAMILPPAMQRLVLEQFGLASYPAAVAFGFKHPIVLISTIAYVIVAGSVPAAERETGLLDLILARPVPRARYLAAHVLLLLVGVVALPAVLLAAASIGISATGRTGEVSWTSYIAPVAALAPLLLLVGAYTLFFAAGARRRGTAVALAIGITVAFFMFEVLASMWARLEPYEWATIFHYFQPVSVVNGEGVPWHPLLLLGLAVALIGAAGIRFQRQRL
ncbi:MAG TPA: ABC transporter permease subunit [Longimicrobiales bacterium]|nr:ABC transporter permease subunit [Longimicrobiales bacterium]